MHKPVVAVLGSFDTWPYMDYLCRVVASHGCIARTSRFHYARKNNGQIGRSVFEPADKEGMNDFLRNRVIAQSVKAVIAFSTPAAHYNEVQWCAELRKPTLGIAFVRDVAEASQDEHCSKLLVLQRPSAKTHSACGGGIASKWTGWRCIKAKPCPFKAQNIAKNILEYFQHNSSFMYLFAVDQIRNSDRLVKSFLDCTLRRPRPLAASPPHG